ncbi:MAG TPA: patatin-like phospholipase family protein [Deltaproteobacteria bacterium]|nr:patatin-like phospholipase family protein [Deltaproteobacteria bacterium]HPP80585.1 patatin-like phospholipase family protein [Deltaproteobacteria bacterium]
MRTLRVYAGPSALRLVRENGLQPDMVKVVAGAAGGPKWLVLCGLDEAVFSSWLMDRASPVFLLGSSVGAWRFAALAQGMDAHRRFKEAYLAQRFSTVPTPSEASREIRKFIDAALEGNGSTRALSHPHARLSLLAVRCTGAFTTENRRILTALMAATALLNAAARRALGLFFTRVLFHDPRDLPPYAHLEGFPLERVGLTPANLAQAVMASGSMPVLMEGVRGIEGAPVGTYRDAGILDYHLAIPFCSSGIVLYPHYTNRITPGWFDKPLSWRKPSSGDMSNVILLCPSRGFVSSLPSSRIPSREDFRIFWGRDEERIRFWRTVADASRALGEEFLEMLENGTLPERMEPLGRIVSA